LGFGAVFLLANLFPDFIEVVSEWWGLVVSRVSLEFIVGKRITHIPPPSNREDDSSVKDAKRPATW